MTRKSRDIRDIPSLTGKEVAQLNFIRDRTSSRFRKHNRQGMRSHIFEVLAAGDLEKETRGEIVGGIRRYPRAVPRYMLRILRTRFATLDESLEEIKKYTLVVHYLEPERIATSTEFIVEYTGTGTSEIVLCGLQEYVQGAILDPWQLLGQNPLETFYTSRFPDDKPNSILMAEATEAIAAFVQRMRRMIFETGFITDLAGYGNLILTRTGQLKLVDINNINMVSINDAIPLDDKGYPSADKSIEVLWLLEEKILKTENISGDPLYKHFLSRDRMKRVRCLEKQFFENFHHAPEYAQGSQ